MGNDYNRTHTTGGSIFSDANVYTNEEKREALLILDVNTQTGGPVGNQGLASLQAIDVFNANFKLAYDLNDSGGFSADRAVFEYIGITNAVLRNKPGSKADPVTGQIQQQLVLTLDPAYTWKDGRSVYVFAKDGIKFAGDAVPATFGKSAGSLGDTNGTYDINGDYRWGEYDTITVSAGSGGPPSPGPGVKPGTPTGLSGGYNAEGGYVYLYWDEVPNAASYYIYRDDWNNNFQSTTDTYFIDYSIPPGTYSYHVCAASGGEQSDWAAFEPIAVPEDGPGPGPGASVSFAGSVPGGTWILYVVSEPINPWLSEFYELYEGDVPFVASADASDVQGNNSAILETKDGFDPNGTYTVFYGNFDAEKAKYQYNVTFTNGNAVIDVSQMSEVDYDR
jgi:hypothetical protein